MSLIFNQWTIQNIREIHEAIVGQLESGAGFIEINFSQTERIDSSGYQLLLCLTQLRDSGHLALSINALSEELKQQAFVLGLDIQWNSNMSKEEGFIEHIKHNMNWKELRETILLLNLSVVQIEMSMSDGSHSVDELIESFTTMSQVIRDSQILIDRLTHDNVTEDEKHIILDQAREQNRMLDRKMTEAIVAFQFYDKLSQRLAHTADGLEGLGDLVACPENISDSESWSKLKNEVRDALSMKEEEELFEMVYQGLPPRQAIEKLRESLLAKKAETGDDDEIEFF